MNLPTHRLASVRSPALSLWAVLLLVTALLYLFGLGGLHVLGFGDEMVYSHIARRTAESGHWLPLQSDFAHMRNTKPPLLFWQAMVAGQWGQHWSLAALRMPSVLYTWATAVAVVLLTVRLQRNRVAEGLASGQATSDHAAAAPIRHWTTGCIAACLFLLFLSTQRFHRSYLTTAPETFWLLAVVLALAWAPRAMLASRRWFPVLAGVATGLACLYKSFVLVVPVALMLALCHWQVGTGEPLRTAASASALRRVAGQLAITCAVALGLFSLWFVADPQPQAIWREFILGENMGKLGSETNYVVRSFGFGPGSIWVVLMAIPSNAGLLLPVVLGAAWAVWPRTRPGAAASTCSAGEKVLWLWILAVTLVFLLPSQRSSRYVLPVMPAVAILVALHWYRIHRVWFAISTLISLTVVAFLARAAWGAQLATGESDLYGPAFWLLCAGLGGAGVVGLLVRRAAAPVCVLLSLGCFTLLSALYLPFNQRLGVFSADDLQKIQGQPVAAAYQATWQPEYFRYLLPGVQLRPVLAPQPRTDTGLAVLLAQAPYALIDRGQGQDLCTSCRVLASRWLLGARPGARPMDALAAPEDFWFSRQYLIEGPARGRKPDRP